jgi:hypothetical protein
MPIKRATAVSAEMCGQSARDVAEGRKEQDGLWIRRTKEGGLRWEYVVVSDASQARGVIVSACAAAGVVVGLRSPHRLVERG